jgi:hypothetical protein
MVGLCGIAANGLVVSDAFQVAVNQPSGSGSSYAASGMLRVFAAPQTLAVGCSDNSNNTVTPVSVLWWVSKIS